MFSLILVIQYPQLTYFQNLELAPVVCEKCYHGYSFVSLFEPYKYTTCLML